MTTLSSASAERGTVAPATAGRAGVPRARATMREVAALAGVSLKTVSRVVNREPGVSDDLVRRVQAAASELDYRHDLTASTLRRSDRKSATLGLLIEDVANPFFSSVHRGIEEVARERGVAVFAASVDGDADRERELVLAFSQRRVDAIIISPTVHEQVELAHEQRGGLAVVCVDREPRGIDADVVVTDNEAGAALATRHLIDHGHTRIAFIGDHGRISTAEHRYEGFVDAMRTAGIAIDPALVHRDADSDESASSIVHRLMALPNPPTAIFGAQNLITMGVARALHQLGLHHEVALIGFDDFSMADALEPAITVVAQDPLTIGRTAAELAFARIDDPDLPTAHVVVPSTLITRGSGEIRPAH